MTRDNMIKIFENKKIRSTWDEEKEEWFFSVVDVVEALTDSTNPRRYWSDLKSKLRKEEGSEVYEKIVQLKLQSLDGKMRQTDAADIEGIFRIIQSIPSPKAEPFKMWLAEVGKERIEETIDPQIAIDRAKETYRKKGYSEEWINQRLFSIRTRNELTDQWRVHGVNAGKEYAILTDALTIEWAGMNTKAYKKLKGLKKENLRDNMSTLELTLNMLAEATTTELTKTHNPKGLKENIKYAKQGGKIAGNARREIEEQTGRPVITNKNALDFINEDLKKLGEIEDD